MGGIKADFTNVLDGVYGLLKNLCTSGSEWKSEGGRFRRREISDFPISVIFRSYPK